MRKVLIFGGCGYLGSVLVQKFLELHYKVIVYDLLLFDNNLAPNKNLNVIKGDIRDINEVEKIIEEVDSVVHLACISNDPSFELNPDLSYQINFKFFKPLVKLCKSKNIKKFIFISSSSVYGVKKEDVVSEEMSLEPLTDYSKFKVKCENILLKYGDKNFCVTILRPATICGYSPRQRFDLVVNIFSNFGYYKKTIEVFGGNQLRPNIHIDDMADVIIHVENQESNNIRGEIFNVGFENFKIIDLANKVKALLNNDVKIVFKKTTDTRSYHISSNKITKQLGFVPKKNIDIAIKDLILAFREKKFTNTFDNEQYFNIKKMLSIDLK